MPAAAQGLNFQDTTFRDSFEEAGIWISEVDGKWSDGFNWESGSPPADGQAVIIKVPTDVVVTIDSAHSSTPMYCPVRRMTWGEAARSFGT